jgi:hypothetical protein
MQQRLAQVLNERQAVVLADVIRSAYSDLVRTSDFNELKEIVRELAAAQQRTEQEMRGLAAAQQRTERQVGELAAAQQRTEQALTELTKVVNTMQPQLASLNGRDLERRFVERAGSYFGRWLRQIRVLWPGQLDRELEQKLDIHLSVEERDEVLRLDAIFAGRLRGEDSSPAEIIYIALEASITVNKDDVARVGERAALLRRCGLRVVPVVAGERFARAAVADAVSHAVAILRNGGGQGWDEALAAA